MPEYSVFSGFGNLEYDSESPDAEKIYDSLRASYIDKKTGIAAVDLTPGSYHEAKLYARAMAIADANASTRRAGNQGDPLKATESIPHFEANLRLSPRPTATLEQRRAAVAARRLVSRGPRRESMFDALTRILGTSLIAVRPIAGNEATNWPTTPATGPGVFTRTDQPAKVVRLLDPVTTLFAPADSYSESYRSQAADLQDTVGANVSRVAQSFTGNGLKITAARFALSKTGAPAGNAVAKVYAHSGTFGTSSVPTGTALATSDAFDVTALTGSFVLTELAFSGANQITLTSGTHYVVAIEYSAGSAGNVISVGVDTSAPAHAGNFADFASGVWVADPTVDVCFYVITPAASAIAYENWDTTRPPLQLVKGDVLSIQPENLGLAEKVTLTAVAGTGATRSLTAVFTKAHDQDASASTGPVPIWASNIGHLLIVVTAAAALDASLVDEVNEQMTRLAKGGTTWSIVEPTTPGAPTIGPFTLSSSPLGAVTIGTIDIIHNDPPFFGPPSPIAGTTAGGTLVTLYGRHFTSATDVQVDGVSVAFTVLSDFRITFTTTAHADGLVNVAIVTPYGTTTHVGVFTFGMAITSLIPSTGTNGGGTAFTLRGYGFLAATDLSINGFTLAVWAIVDDNTITGTTDAIGGPATIPVIVDDGFTTVSVPFVFT